MLSQQEKKTIKERKIKVNFNALQILYFCIFIITFSLNIIILSIFFTIAPKLDYPLFRWIFFDYTLTLYIIIITITFINMNVSIYELVRFMLFLKTNIKDAEGAIHRAKGFIGTKIIRIFYLVFMVILIIVMKICIIVADAFLSGPRPPEASDFGIPEFMLFYMIFAPVICVQVFTQAIAPHLMSFSLDYKKRQYITKIIVYSNIWIAVLLFINFFDLRWFIVY
ncbi:MAG: hypothetical protein ACFFBP_00295 [Promethearchaeota archaeon]